MQRILAIDQGTTSSRAIVYDQRCEAKGTAQKEFKQHFPAPGRVEHDAEEIWRGVRETIREAMAAARCKASDIAAIGITNQRETVVVWDRKTGRPLHRAIVWQDRRTAPLIERLRRADKENLIRRKTGLLLDPCFSASKLHWILRNVKGAAAKAKRGDLLAGTIDSWLTFKLTGGKTHVTDVTNASRTMLMDIRSGEWDDELLELFDIPRRILPRIVSSSGVMDAKCTGGVCDGVAVAGMIGDQQAALFGQLCNTPGMVKCTYGTGCFMLMHTGAKPVPSRNRLLTTPAWKIGEQPMEYALEGSVFVGGAAIQWLRDGLGIIRSAPDINRLAEQVKDAGGTVLVPAFTGLGAPHWDSAARGLFAGITRATSAAHLARATLEGIAFQVADLIQAMQADSKRSIPRLRADGGASASNLLMQIQADLLGVPVERPANLESTALGAAMMAGLAAGLWKDTRSLAAMRKTDRVFKSKITPTARRKRLTLWHEAVRRASGWSD